MELLEQEIILKRDVEQLQRDNSQLQDKNERLKKESLAVINLIEKQKNTLKKLEEESVKVLDRVRDEKVAWESQKADEAAKLEARELAANKILNREGYVKHQEQGLIKKQAEVARQAQATAEKEATFVQREELVKNLESQADKHWQEAKKVMEYAKESLNSLQEKIIKEVNKWEIK